MLRRFGIAAVALLLAAGTVHAAPRKVAPKRAVQRKPAPVAAAAVAPPPAAPAPAAPPSDLALTLSAPPPAPAPAAAPAPAPAPAPVLAPAPRAIDASPDRDVAQPASAPPPRHLLTITLNPLPIAAGRYGLNAEIVPLAHHAIVASAYWQQLQPWVLDRVLPKSVERGSLPGRIGAEIGYRLYSGSDGASGIFVGPSFVWMPIFYPQVSEQLRAELVPLDAFGGAIDVGAQAILGSGFTIGGGAGVMALAYTPPRSVAAPPGTPGVPSFVEPHVLPRLLMQAGWSF